MIKEVSQLQMPTWLSTINPQSEFPGIEKITTDSLYYPASGLNGTPVKYLAGNVYSFIYADYGTSKHQFLSDLNGDSPDSGFKHYHSICQREIYTHQVVPGNWQPSIMPTSQKEIERLIERQQNCTPFGHWSVWQRNEDAGEEVGPERFSFLFLAGEMSAIYQGLYNRLEIAPRILAIIQPGTMGGEWESVTSNDSFFKRVVVSNPAGIPEYLLHGGYGRGFYEHPCWCEYEGERLIQLPERYAGLWQSKA